MWFEIIYQSNANHILVSAIRYFQKEGGYIMKYFAMRQVNGDIFTLNGRVLETTSTSSMPCVVHCTQNRKNLGPVSIQKPCLPGMGFPC